MLVVADGAAFGKCKPSMDVLYKLFRWRMPEEGRPDIKELLAYHGLQQYDPLEWCKKRMVYWDVISFGLDLMMRNALMKRRIIKNLETKRVLEKSSTLVYNLLRK